MSNYLTFFRNILSELHEKGGKRDRNHPIMSIYPVTVEKIYI